MHRHESRLIAETFLDTQYTLECAILSKLKSSRKLP